MKKYSNIPLKERKRNADRCYRHEVRAEIRAKEREAEAEQLEIKRMYEEKYRAFEQENEAKTDKERQEEEAFAKLREFLKWREESEDTE